MLAANVSRASASVCVPLLGEPLPLYSRKCTAALGHPPRAILREARLCACLRVFVRCELEGRVRTRSYVDDRSALAACIRRAKGRWVYGAQLCLFLKVNLETASSACQNCSCVAGGQNRKSPAGTLSRRPQASLRETLLAGQTEHHSAKRSNRNVHTHKHECRGSVSETCRCTSVSTDTCDVDATRDLPLFSITQGRYPGWKIARLEGALVFLAVRGRATVKDVHGCCRPEVPCHEQIHI